MGGVLGGVQMSTTLSKQERQQQERQQRERQQVGQSRRRELPRSRHAHAPGKQRERDAFHLLQEAAGDRLPHLLQLKYQRMAASPFAYLRGAVPVMAYDLSLQPHTGIFTQLCGDAHVRNLGGYAAPDGRMVFDINDFDETVRGPFEWDVKRMATSIHLAGREVHEPEDDCRKAVRTFLRRYRKSLHSFAEMPVLELGRYQIHRAAELETIEDVFSKAERSTPLKLRDALTESAEPKTGSADRVFRSEPPVLKRLQGGEKAAVLDSMTAYLWTIEAERRHLLSRYRPVDAAFKVVGTGSVGLRAYVIYFEGNGPKDPLFLQVKQEVASAWAPYLPAAAANGGAAANEGRRVADGQRAMQVQSDPFLGYTAIDGRDYLVRQLNDHKGSVNLGTLDARLLANYADLCGELLARGHARAGDPDALAGYVGRSDRFDVAVAEFARRYADRTERDWRALKKVLRG